MKHATAAAVIWTMLVAVAAARATDEEHTARARDMSAKAIVYLRAQQDAASGGWAVPPAGADAPHFPAISALAVNGMLLHPGVTPEDPDVAEAIAYLLKWQQEDGGIYDRVLPSYNTSIAISALARIDREDARRAVARGQEFLRTVQWGESAAGLLPGGDGARIVGKDHPFYGGVGYGQHGRPDLSNLAFFVQAMHDSGVRPEDPAMQRAIVFLQRVQMVEKAGEPPVVINDMPFARGSRQGGFIYATASAGEGGTPGQSFAGTLEESLDDGSKVSRLRAYGSMTYAGFKSYLYAGLSPDDPRVTEALRWISSNYTLEENPGLGTDGMYYYFVTFARALGATGRPTVPVDTPAGRITRDWGNDLVDRLAGLQNEDGSFRSVDDRWMENNPVLITAYALLALEHAAAAGPPQGSSGVPGAPAQ